MILLANSIFTPSHPELRTMGQNPYRLAEGQGVIASAAKQSLPENRDCFVA